MSDYDTISSRPEAAMVSLLVVARNEIGTIGKCLESLLSQDYPDNRLELILVDGCSDDGTEEVMRQKANELTRTGLRTILLRNDRKILSAGWNMGIRAAQGQFVCRIDAHSELCASYVSHGVKCLMAPGNAMVAAVGGWWIHSATSMNGRLMVKLMESPFAVGNSPFRRRPSALEKSDTAVYGVYRKTVFEQIGFFDESLARNQDMVLHHKMKERGYCFLTHPDMQITYYVRNTWRQLMRKAFSDGMWVALAGVSRFRLRHKVPLLFVLYLLVFLCLAVAFQVLPKTMLRQALLLISASPLVAYFILAGYAGVRSVRGVAGLGLLPFFLSFHVAYGTGTLCGFCRKVFHGSPADADK